MNYWLTERAVLFTFKGVDERAQFVSIPVADIPDDAIVLAVHPDHLTGCFVFTVASMEFAPVEEGVMPPRAPVKYKTIQLKKAEKQ